MSADILILQLAVLAVVLESDLGRRRVGWFRVWRPVVTIALVVPFFLSTVPSGYANLLLQAAGVVLGVVLGVGVASRRLVSMSWDPAYQPRHPRWLQSTPRPAVVTHAGIGYAAVWIAACVLRLGFAYGAEHWFPAALGRFLTAHDLSSAALGNGFAFLAITMSLARSLTFAARARRVRQAHSTSMSASTFDRRGVGAGRLP